MFSLQGAGAHLRFERWNRCEMRAGLQHFSQRQFFSQGQQSSFLQHFGSQQADFAGQHLSQQPLLHPAIGFGQQPAAGCGQQPVG